jgi:hypothetical protein
MKRVARDGIFAFVIAGLIGAYTYVLGLGNGTKETVSADETPTDNDSTEEGSTEEEPSED